MLKFQTEDKDILLGDDAEEIVRKLAGRSHNGFTTLEGYMEEVRHRVLVGKGVNLTFEPGDFEGFLRDLEGVNLITSIS